MPDFRKHSLDEILASVDAARTLSDRMLAAMALLHRRVRDDRILAALVRILPQNPVGVSACLARYGDPRAVADLARAFDSDELIASADCPICAAERLGALAHAIELLGGTLTDVQRARLARAERDADRAWVTASTPLPAPPWPNAMRPARDGRPGRNEPCPCGSGKKFKRCCALQADAAGRTH